MTERKSDSKSSERHLCHQHSVRCTVRGAGRSATRNETHRKHNSQLVQVTDCANTGTRVHLSNCEVVQLCLRPHYDSCIHPQMEAKVLAALSNTFGYASLKAWQLETVLAALAGDRLL